MFGFRLRRKPVNIQMYDKNGEDITAGFSQSPPRPMPKVKPARPDQLLIGCTLRDRFATAAMQGIMANPSGNSSDWEHLAKLSYEIADAMLKERQNANK